MFTLSIHFAGGRSDVIISATSLGDLDKSLAITIAKLLA